MKRFNVVENGYNIEEVNTFIDVVIKKLEKLSSDNNNYLKELELLKKQVQEKDMQISNSADVKVSKALIAAQETTDRMKELAKEEADLIIKEAKENANAIVHEALINAQKAEQQYELLKKNYNVYKVKTETLVKSMLELIENEE